MRALAKTRGESIHGQQAELYPRLAGAGDEAYGLWEAARRSREEGYLAEARSGGEARDPEDLAGGGYEQVALAVMRALAGGGGARAATQLILNTPNSTGRLAGAAGSQAAIPGLPGDAVVEVPCTVTPEGAVPIPQDSPAEPQLGLLQQVKKVELLTVRAASTGDRDAALEAFAEHPLVGSAELANALLTGYEGAFPELAGLWRQ
jgi:6-phospho-beta-glucosidase